MERAELQQQLDVQKWLDSEQAGRDMCGEYDYCAYCDKNVTDPCACAYAEMTKPQPEYSVDDEDVDTDEDIDIDEDECEETIETCLGKKFDYDKVMKKKAARKSLTFAEKYALSDDIVKERYATIKDALTTTPRGTAKIKSRISKQCDTYRREGNIVAKVTIIGASLRVNLPLDPYAEEFCDGKTPHVATGHKKVYEEVPFQFKVNSKLALKRALALIERIK